DVRDVLPAGGLLEAANNLDDGVHLADVREELVAQPFADGGAADDAGDVHEAEAGGDDLLAVDVLADDLETRVGDGDHADVRLDGREGVVGRERPRLGEGVEEGGLANIRETNNSGFHDGYSRAVGGGRRGKVFVRTAARPTWCA